MTSPGAASTHAEQPQRARREPAPVLEAAPAEYAAPAPLFDAVVAAARPAADPPARPWQTAQRQAVAAGLGRRLGNRQVQRFVAAPAGVAAPGPHQPETPARPAPAAEAPAPAAALTPAPAPRLQRGLWDTITGAVADPRGAALSAIAGFARNLPGYTLLCLILGRDPIADRPVERNARTVVQAALGLVPGGNLLFENLNASGALDRAFGWLEEQWGQLGLTWSAITGLFRQAWDSISLTDFLNPAGVWERLKGIFLGPINRIKNFVVSAAQKVMEFIFEGVLGRLGGGQVLALLRQAGAAFQTIFRDPVRFLGNLLTAVRQGLTNFVGNIARHLQQGLMSWLLGALAQTGLQLPRTFDLASIFSLVMQVLGLTWQAIRSRAVRVLGERVVSALEGAFELFQVIRQRGLIGLWEVVRERLSELGSVVLNGIRELVITQVIQAGIRWVIGLLGGPAGAVIQAIQAIYNVITWITTNASRLAALVQAVAGSIQAIAAGALGAAAQRVEEALARTVPMVISFLASLLGLGDLGARVRQLIQRIRQPIERAIDWVIERARAAASRLMGRGTQSARAGDPEDSPVVTEGLEALRTEEQQRADGQDGFSRGDAEGVAADVKRRYPVFQTLRVVDGGATWDYAYTLQFARIKGGRQKDGTPGSNIEQNRQFRAAMREIERRLGRQLSRDEQRRLHDAVTGQDYGYHEIVDEGLALFAAE
ncbi:MAG: hypothetical protein JNK29_03365 [Anaerolineales bacterium]|nr:hypothetical protein [Anaerolineales bacterium]